MVVKRRKLLRPIYPKRALLPPMTATNAYQLLDSVVETP